MKHKHHDLIVAKAANMDLVVFRKNYDDSWGEVECHDCTFMQDFEYFLCLTQHNENGQCLHWLNGGEVQQSPLDIEQLVTTGNKRDWMSFHSFMQEGLIFRIKPKKEKRWIAYSTNQKRLGCLSFDSEQEARSYYIHEVEEPQFIEIEVEVQMINEKFTQSDYNKSCDEFKSVIDGLVKESGFNCISVAVAMDKDIIEGLYHFQEEVNPAADFFGIKTKSLSEIFGKEIKLNVIGDVDGQNN